MFWKIVMGASKTAFHLQKTASAVGLSIIVILTVHDFLKKRKRE
jgi:hypothetical protein